MGFVDINERDTALSRRSAWMRGYRCGQSGDVTLDFEVTPREDRRDFVAGYLRGSRERRLDSLLKAWERPTPIAYGHLLRSRYPSRPGGSAE
jgi:hypothetical protein